MHILFVHQNFPAQFGHIADYLVRRHGFRCTFVSEKPAGQFGGTERVSYQVRGGANRRTHYCARTFENAVCHSHGVYEALRGRPDLRPDLIVGHSGFGSTLFLRDLMTVRLSIISNTSIAPTIQTWTSVPTSPVVRLTGCAPGRATP